MKECLDAEVGGGVGVIVHCRDACENAWGTACPVAALSLVTDTFATTSQQLHARQRSSRQSRATRR